MHPPRIALVPGAAPPYDGQTPAGGRSPGEDDGPSAPPAPVAVAPPVPEPGRTPGEAAWARPFAQAIVETVAGIRPFRQVISATTERAQAQLKRLIPVLRADGDVRVRRVLTSRADPGVVEVTVIAGFGPRTRALAMRFEQIPARLAAPGLPPRPARWLCTDVQTP